MKIYIYIHLNVCASEPETDKKNFFFRLIFYLIKNVRRCGAACSLAAKRHAALRFKPLDAAPIPTLLRDIRDVLVALFFLGIDWEWE